jgi:amino acid transporter
VYSPSALDRTRPPAEPSSRLKGNLGTGGLLLTALALNAPLAMMAGFLPIGIGLGLGAATPLVFLAVMVLVLVFAVGLVTMARHMRQPGAYYTYISAGLGRIPGLGAGFVALTGYLLLGGGSYVLSAVLADNLVHGFLHGPSLPWWLWSVTMWALVTGLSLFNIDVSTKVLGVFLCVEVAIVLIWDARVLSSGGPNGLGIDVTAQLGSGSPGIALLFGVASLIGFESLQVFRAETHNPFRTIPRASYLTIVCLAGFYALGSYSYLVAFGSGPAIAGAASPAASFLGSLGQYAGVVIRDVANVMLLTSAFAALLAIHNIAARYCFTLGRDGVLPVWLGRVNSRHHSPTRAAAAVAVAIAALPAVVAVLRVSPVTAYVAMSGLGVWTVILLMFVTAFGIIVFFRDRPGLERSLWKTRTAPALAVLGFGYVVVQATLNSDLLMGGNSVIATCCILAAVAIAVAAMLYGAWLRTGRPNIWERIGEQDGQAPE